MKESCFTEIGSSRCRVDGAVFVARHGREVPLQDHALVGKHGGAEVRRRCSKVVDRGARVLAVAQAQEVDVDGASVRRRQPLHSVFLSKFHARLAAKEGEKFV